MARLKTAARGIRNRVGAKNVIGLFWSISMQRHVVYESLVERLMFLFFEWLGKRRYTEQPFTIKIPYGSKLVKYTPDAEVEEDTGELVLYQAKPKVKAEEPTYVAAMTAYTEHLAHIGFRHILFVPEKYSTQFWLNLRMSYGYAIRHWNSLARTQLLLLLSPGNVWTLKDAVSLCRDNSIHLGVLYTEIFFRGIYIELDQEFNEKSIIRGVPG